MKLEIELELTSARGLATLIGIGLLAAAVATELRKPAAMRTWHGTVSDWVPYDLRPPTLSRVLSRVWAPDDPRVLVSTPFGVGWTVNFAGLIKSVTG
jgi:hypothetical protein